jgi:hypothetical protein
LHQNANLKGQLRLGCDIHFLLAHCCDVVQVKLQLMVNPYGTADASTDPETVASNFLTLPEARMRPVNEDDLEGMCREPDIEPEADEVVGIASTDDMELKVLPSSVLSFGSSHRRINVHAFATYTDSEAHENVPSRSSAMALQYAGAVVPSIEEVYRHPRQTVSALVSSEQPSSCSRTCSEGPRCGRRSLKPARDPVNGTAALEHAQPTPQQEASETRRTLYDGSSMGMSCAYRFVPIESSACQVSTTMH